MTSGISDTLSSAIGITNIGISNFCGQYKFTLTTSSSQNIAQVCTNNCGYYNNYTLAEISPISNDLVGFISYTLSVDFKN